MKPKQADNARAQAVGSDPIQAALNFSAELVAASPKALMSSLAALKSDMWDIPVDDLRVLPDFNVRIKNDGYRAHIRALADSIKLNGFYKDKPLSGYGALSGKKPVIYITDGHCRLEAVKLAVAEGAPIFEIPVVIKDRSVSMEDLTVAMVRTSEGRRLSPMEKAIACKRLANYGWLAPRIAESLGITVEYVEQLLLLAGAPRSMRDMVESGEATAALVIDTLRKHGAEAPGVISAALAQAKSGGKDKVTARFMPDQVRKKAFSSAAPEMFNVIERVRAHQSFSGLDADLREMIERLTKLLAATPPGPSDV